MTVRFIGFDSFSLLSHKEGGCQPSDSKDKINDQCHGNSIPNAEKQYSWLESVLNEGQNTDSIDYMVVFTHYFLASVGYHGCGQNNGGLNG